MGVEYQHWIVAVDPSFVPAREAAARTHDVLTAWGLGGERELFDLASGGAAPCGGGPDGDGAREPPANALIVYRELVEGEAFARIGGETLDEEGDDGYVAKRLVVLSEEQQLLGSSEEIFVEVIEGTATPTKGQRRGLAAWHWAPRDAPLRARVRGPQPLVFSGVFRAAVIIDFGKSLPALAMMDDRRLEPDFVEAIAHALGAPVEEFGFFY